MDIDSRGPVLVTGAGSGIGLATVRALLAAGHPVYAGARRQVHRDMLQALGAVPLTLDVRDADQVQHAAEAIHHAGRGLFGLVHNAGVGGIGVLQSWPDADLQSLFDTHVFGAHRLTRALLPLLLASRGRIVCIGSQGGSITMPLMGPYTMSKHALEAYASCLQQELSPHGVVVSIVQPGAVATDIGDNGRAGSEARLRATEPPFAQMAAEVLVALQAPAAPRPDEPESAANRRHARARGHRRRGVARPHGGAAAAALPGGHALGRRARDPRLDRAPDRRRAQPVARLGRGGLHRALPQGLARPLTAPGAANRGALRRTLGLGPADSTRILLPQWLS